MANPFNNNHLQLLDYVKTINSNDGTPINIFNLKSEPDTKILSKWAQHFRNHYCLDSDIDILRSGTGKTRQEYLFDLVLPDKGTHSGPATMSGDFGEIIISDYVEYMLNYWVPRTRFSERQNRSNPTQGVDVLGLRVIEPNSESPDDELLIYEVKAKLTSNARDESKKRLEIAIRDSKKDFDKRKAESLNALKRYYHIRGKTDEMNKIQRFQNPTDNKYKELSGAAAIILTSSMDDTQISQVDASTHPNITNLQLIIINGNNLMDLVYSLYERAGNEA